MGILNLTNQKTQIVAALPYFQGFENAMEQRRTIWNKLSIEQKKKWLKAAAGTKANPKTLQESKDPVLWIAIRMKRLFDTFELQEDE